MMASILRGPRKLSAKAASRLRILFVGGLVGFIVMLAVQLQPSAPEARLPREYRLSALIERQQQQNEQTRQEVEELRKQIAQTREALASQKSGLAAQNSVVENANTAAGIDPVRGTGFTVTLDDSTLRNAPTGNLNDLVIHSQDVQAVVNGMWQAGAQAISINGQRLIATSAVLCVGNTLLLNGTVHSPPYEISGIGVNRDDFLADKLVQQVRADATRFSLGFSVGRDQTLEVPAYTGPIVTKYAQPS